MTDDWDLQGKIYDQFLKALAERGVLDEFALARLKQLLATRRGSLKPDDIMNALFEETLS